MVYVYVVQGRLRGGAETLDVFGAKRRALQWLAEAGYQLAGETSATAAVYERGDYADTVYLSRRTVR